MILHMHTHTPRRLWRTTTSTMMMMMITTTTRKAKTTPTAIPVALLSFVTVENDLQSYIYYLFTSADTAYKVMNKEKI